MRVVGEGAPARPAPKVFKTQTPFLQPTHEPRIASERVTEAEAKALLGDSACDDDGAAAPPLVLGMPAGEPPGMETARGPQSERI